MIRGRGNTEQDFQHSLEEVRQTLRSISRAISSLNLRFEPHPDAKEFKRNQLIHILSGGAKAVNLLNLQSDKPKQLANEYLHQVTPYDGHLAILHATEVGCHHPELSEDDDTSALDLHGSSGLCIRCPEKFPTVISEQLNPFHCWRRGHRSGYFGFVYQLVLRYFNNSGKWIFNSNSSELRCTPYIWANISDSSTPEGSNICSNIKILEGKVLGQMLISIHIPKPRRFHRDSRLTEVEQLLQQQLLVSQNVSNHSSIPLTDFDFTEVPKLLQTILRDIELTWSPPGGGLSDDVQRHLGMCVIHQGAEHLVDELKPMLSEFTRKHSTLHILEETVVKRDNPQLFSQLFPRGGFEYGDLLVCLSLDPIIDLGGIQSAE